MMEFIRELIGDRWIKLRVDGFTSQNKQTGLGISQEGVLNVTFFQVVTYGILGELGNRVGELLFADDLAIYHNKK